MDRYVLDTSALLTLIENEEGVDYVEYLLIEAAKCEIELFISVISCIEVFYISLQEQSLDIADERIELIKALLLIIEAVDENLIKTAGKIKAENRISFADSCIAALAKEKEAILVHKDPEFEQLKKEIVQKILPYKSA